MPYTKVFNKPYADGYKDRPDLSTPETAANLNAKDNALEHIEDYLVNQKVSDLQNDSGFITRNDVSEAIKGKADSDKVYTKEQINEKLEDITDLIPDNKELLEDLSDSEGKLAYKGQVIEGGGGNANERELTYAEYQALSEEEQMNGTNYFVKDYPSGSGGGGGSSKHEYSFEERIVGTWIDGKPIYEKTYDVTNTSTGTAYTNIASKIDNITDIDMIITGRISRQKEGKNHSCADLMCQLESVNSLKVYTGVTWTNMDYITLQYTKTTD